MIVIYKLQLLTYQNKDFKFIKFNTNTATIPIARAPVSAAATCDLAVFLQNQCPPAGPWHLIPLPQQQHVQLNWLRAWPLRSGLWARWASTRGLFFSSRAPPPWSILTKYGEGRWEESDRWRLDLDHGQGYSLVWFELFRWVWTCPYSGH